MSLANHPPSIHSTRSSLCNLFYNTMVFRTFNRLFKCSRYILHHFRTSHSSVSCGRFFNHAIVFLTFRNYIHLFIRVMVRVQGTSSVFLAPISQIWAHNWNLIMMTSSNGNIFCVTGHFCREFTSPRWIPRTEGSDAELWCFLWSASE